MLVKTLFKKKFSPFKMKLEFVIIFLYTFVLFSFTTNFTVSTDCNGGATHDFGLSKK